MRPSTRSVSSLALLAAAFAACTVNAPTVIPEDADSAAPSSTVVAELPPGTPTRDAGKDGRAADAAAPRPDRGTDAGSDAASEGGVQSDAGVVGPAGTSTGGRARSLHVGEKHACVITTAGGAKCWGENSSGQLGLPGVSPRDVAGDLPGYTSGVTSLGIGCGYTCVANTSGKVKCVGANTYGQLGDNTRASRAYFGGDVGLSASTSEVAAGCGHACAVQPGGGVACWGDNFSGQLGNGSTQTSSPSPVPVSGLTDIKALALGRDFSCALSNGGAVKCWGDQPGDLSTTPTIAPALVIPSGVRDLKAGPSHVCALLNGGSVKCWGNNANGELGNNSTSSSGTPVDVVGSNFSSIALGTFHTCATTVDGKLFCWGTLPGGTRNLVPRVRAEPTNGITSVGAGFSSTCGLSVSGSVLCLEGGRTTVVQGINEGDSAVQVGGGDSFSCARTFSGAVKCWGNAGYNQLGDSTSDDRPAPSLTFLDSQTTDLAVGRNHACVVTALGTVQCWGTDSAGELGAGSLGSGAYRIVTALGLTGIRRVYAGGKHTCATTVGGELKCWGDNFYGESGTGSNRDVQLLPFTVAAGVGAVALGKDHTCAESAGAVKCWGDNNYGQLGDTTTYERPLPTTVTGLPGGVIALAAGDTHSCALTRLGEVRCWGWNAFGELGDGTKIQRNTATAVVGLGSGAVAITGGAEHTCALTSSREVKCWGRNARGQLGTGSTTDASVPTLVPGATGALSIAAGRTHTCAVMPAGSLKCWGSNGDRELGDGTSGDKTRPSAVVGL
jgi:alpha-tubulin suppressor-like RCC1 family protein